MTRSDLLVCLVISGSVAGCHGSPAAPSGVELFAAGRVSMTFQAQDQTPADAQVRIESGRTGLYDYDSAWKWALSISKAERASRFAEIVRTNRR